MTPDPLPLISLFGWIRFPPRAGEGGGGGMGGDGGRGGGRDVEEVEEVGREEMRKRKNGEEK